MMIRLIEQVVVLLLVMILLVNSSNSARYTLEINIEGIAALSSSGSSGSSGSHYNDLYISISNDKKGTLCRSNFNDLSDSRYHHDHYHYYHHHYYHYQIQLFIRTKGSQHGHQYLYCHYL